MKYIFLLKEYLLSLLTFHKSASIFISLSLNSFSGNENYEDGVWEEALLKDNTAKTNSVL